MRRRIAVLILLPALVLGTGGCDSSDDVPREVDQTLLQLAECTGLGVQGLAGIFNSLLELALLIDEGGSLPPGVSWNPDTGEFSLGVDLDDDEIDDATVGGTVTGYDPWNVGDTATITWNLSGSTEATGNGTWRLTRELTGVRLRGESLLEGGPGCSVSSSSMELFVNPLTVQETGPTGFVSFEVTAGGSVLENGLVGFDGGDFANVSATYDGQPVSFRINLDTWAPDWK